jgi:peptidoglycan/LPS O-acetylase OafA/YrhL/lysophospholipase L1-like esterase
VSTFPTPAFPHLRSLDGLRGVAVALVVAYHLAPSAVPGGFLGVDVFFVLSGFLITSLIVTEVQRREGFRAGAFYIRRIRRLLPAVLLLLLGAALYATVWAEPDELDRLREHSLWTLGYLANWNFIADGTTYTDVVVGQSPLRHTWSLAIEEQFYILFPLLVLGLGRLVRWRADVLRWVLGSVAVVGATASAVWMAAQWGDGTDPSRGYFGTDTRAHSLLVGVVLGVVLVGRPVRSGPMARPAAALAIAGAVGLMAATIATHEDSSTLQHGGFLLVALATAAIIAGGQRVGPLRWVLTRRALVGLGVISYGVYLWHWPVIILLDELRTGLDGVALAALRIGVTLAVSIASFFLVEQPIRRGRLPAARQPHAVVLSAAGALSVAALVVAATVVPPVKALPPRPPTAVAPEVAAATELPLGVVMFGDSVARSISGAGGDLDEWRPELSSFDPSLVRLWNLARIYCSYLEGTAVMADGRLSDPRMLCGGWRERLTDVLEQDDYDDIVLVALANDAGPRVVDGERIELGSDRHQELLTAFLDELRGIAQSHGAEVVLMALPPRADSLRADIEQDSRRGRLMREELSEYAAERPGTRVLDLFDQVCPDGDCEHPAGGFDPAWRPDGWHFGPEGARWVADWVTAQLIDLEPSPDAALDANSPLGQRAPWRRGGT